MGLSQDQAVLFLLELVFFPLSLHYLYSSMFIFLEKLLYHQQSRNPRSHHVASPSISLSVFNLFSLCASFFRFLFCFVLFSFCRLISFQGPQSSSKMAVQSLESAESSSSTPHSLPTPNSQKRVSASPVQMCIPGPGRLSLVAVSGYSLLWSLGFSLQWLLLLQSTGSRCMGSVVLVHGLRCPPACGIFLDQGSNPCPLHWQVDSLPLDHQGSLTC